MSCANQQLDKDELDRRFSYHPPTKQTAEAHDMLRNTMRATADIILALCPPSRESGLAMTNLETSLMWANAAIARNGLKDGGLPDDVREAIVRVNHP